VWQVADGVPAHYSHEAATLGDSLYVFGGTDSTSEHANILSLPLVQ